jgi:hypothetical protein
MSKRSAIGAMVGCGGLTLLLVNPFLGILTHGWVPPWYALLALLIAGGCLIYGGIRHWMCWDFARMEWKHAANPVERELPRRTPQRNYVAVGSLLGATLGPLLGLLVRAAPEDVRNTILLILYGCTSLICGYLTIAMLRHLISRRHE